MTKRTVLAVSMCLAVTSLACGRREDPSGLAREPLARANPAVPAAPPAPAAPARAEGKASETPPIPVVRADKAAQLEAPAKKLARSAPSPGDAKSSEPLTAGEGLKVKRLVITRSIDNREPGAAEQLGVSDEPLFAFVELENKSEAADSVVVTFEREGKSVGHIRLEVPAKNSRWRTWGKTKQVRQAGAWVALVKSADGKELARKSFVVE